MGWSIGRPELRRERKKMLYFSRRKLLVSPKVLVHTLVSGSSSVITEVKEMDLVAMNELYS